MLIRDELRYSEEHIWVRYEENRMVTLGMTDFAQLQIGGLDYIALPNEGDEIVAREPLGTVECGSLLKDLYSPVCGRVVSVNREVIYKPVLVNYSPYDQGWIVRAKLSSLCEMDRLMDADDYERYLLTSYPPI